MTLEVYLKEQLTLDNIKGDVWEHHGKRTLDVGHGHTLENPFRYKHHLKAEWIPYLTIDEYDDYFTKHREITPRGGYFLYGRIILPFVFKSRPLYNFIKKCDVFRCKDCEGRAYGNTYCHANFYNLHFQKNV